MITFSLLTELGISPKDIKGYSEIKKVFSKWDKELKELKISEKAGKKILTKLK